MRRVFSRRFTRSNIQHPAYEALGELGKAIETIFLCRYLSSEGLRQEIHEGLNVVEDWHTANGFICYGKGGEFAANRQEDLEMGLLCLHLLQASLCIRKHADDTASSHRPRRALGESVPMAVPAT